MVTLNGDTADDDEFSSKVSDRKAAANLSNARLSSGPRTTAGKQRSSQNALKHGAYASDSVAIPRGQFAEDPDGLARYTADIIASLGPRDAIEQAAARRIASCHVNARRLSRLEAVRLAPPESAPARGTRPEPRSRATLEQLATEARRFATWLGTGRNVGVDFEFVLGALYLHALAREESGDRLEIEPDEIAALDFQDRVEWYIEHHFASRSEAAMFAANMAAGRVDAVDALNLAEYRTAGYALEQFDRISVIGQRKSRELDHALREYRSLQQRPAADLTTALPRNEPTEAA